MPLPQQQLAFVPVQFRRELAFPCSIDDLEGIVQQGQALFNLACDLTRSGQEHEKKGHQRLRPGGSVSSRTAAQERYSLRNIVILNLTPTAKDRFERTPVGETLLGRHGNQLVGLLVQSNFVSEERKRQAAERQARRQRRRMRQPPSLGDCSTALC